MNCTCLARSTWVAPASDHTAFTDSLPRLVDFGSLDPPSNTLPFCVSGTSMFFICSVPKSEQQVFAVFAVFADGHLSRRLGISYCDIHLCPCPRLHCFAYMVLLSMEASG